MVKIQDIANFTQMEIILISLRTFPVSLFILGNQQFMVQCIVKLNSEVN